MSKHRSLSIMVLFRTTTLGQLYSIYLCNDPRAQQFTKKGLSGTVGQQQTNSVMEEHDNDVKREQEIGSYHGRFCMAGLGATLYQE